MANSRSVLNIRMTNGQPLRAEFDSSTTLQQVKSYVDGHRTDGYAPYHLGTAFPRQTFSDPDTLGLTLELAGLSPSGTLIMTAMDSASSHQPAHQQQSISDMLHISVPQTLTERPASRESRPQQGIWYYLSYFNPMTYIWDDDDDDSTASSFPSQARSTGNGGNRQNSRAIRGPNIHGFSSLPQSSSADESGQPTELQPRPGKNGWEYGPNLALEKHLKQQYANPLAEGASSAPR
eukprot:TRINITY_DN3712_c0_g2_i4.p1 TRINITY_DN3712_c0_g2~~TRINITY_DN3712_c0_g2_i4.p1  ORF type:complete len:235 (-),score=31.70 TRINITY_DN3712_c0_g2_i4:507-1211(-)